jgi:hypothetical protein
LFQIAKTVGGCTVAELEDRLSVAELFEWSALFTLEADEHKRALAESQRGARRGR